MPRSTSSLAEVLAAMDIEELFRSCPKLATEAAFGGLPPKSLLGSRWRLGRSIYREGSEQAKFTDQVMLNSEWIWIRKMSKCTARSMVDDSEHTKPVDLVYYSQNWKLKQITAKKNMKRRCSGEWVPDRQSAEFSKYTQVDATYFCAGSKSQKKAELKHRSKFSGKERLCLRGEHGGLVTAKTHGEVVSF